MTDVFISYAKTDAPAVRQLADAVKRLGYSVWWDEELPAHLSYSDVIAERIEAARAAIVVWSKEAAASQWVRAEADVARNQKKLIQASIDGRMPPMPFNQIQFAAIGDWQGEDDHLGWQKVKASLAALVGPAAPAVSAPAAEPQAPHKWHKLLIAVIAAAFLFIAGAGLFAWLRGGSPPPQTAPATEQRAERPPRDKAGPAAPGPRQQAQARQPASDGAKPAARARRYCLGPGRGTPECAELRARYGRRR
jgi:hypothetical protein